MEFLTNLVVDSVLDPVVLVPAAAVSAALLSGLVARVAQLWEERPPTRHRDVDNGYGLRHEITGLTELTEPSPM